MDFTIILEWAKKIFTSSSSFSNWITGKAVSFGLNTKQATSIPLFINLVLIFLLICFFSKFKKWLKIGILAFLGWILIGFFI